MARLARSGWILVLLGLAGCGAGVIPTIHSESERLDVARRMAQNHQCVVAIELLKTYVANNAGSADVDHAIYLLGHCYLETKDWVSASLEFERLLRDYPESDSSAAASFALGQALFEQARPPDFDQEYTHKALDQWQAYVQNYPGHWQNAEARKRIAQVRHRLATKLMNTGELYLKLKLPRPARVYFERVIQKYGDLNGVLGEAMLGIARSDAMDGKKDQAITEFKKVEQQFPGKPVAARAERERARLEN